MWDVLGIEPTNDERAVKRAYATLLKQNRPDKDPKAFQELRDAYQWCLRATKWVDYDEDDDPDPFDDDQFDDDDDEVSERPPEVAATGSSTASDGGDQDDEPLEPFVAPDGPVERVVVGEVDEASESSMEPAVRVVIEEAADKPAEDAGSDGDNRMDGWERSESVTADDVESGETSGPDSDHSTEEPRDAGSDEARKTVSELVGEIDNVFQDMARARDGNAWSAWFAAAEHLSLTERERLRMAFVDRAIDAWYDDSEDAVRRLKSMPHQALNGLQDLLGWPQSESELSEMMPDDLILLLGELLDFEILTSDDRKAFFEESDQAMVDVAMKPDKRRHANGFRYGPFWCLYRRQNRRVGMAVGGPVLIAAICAGVAAAGVQVLFAIALIALFLFYRAGGVRIWWPLLCVIVTTAAVAGFGPVVAAPALYLLFAVPLHIEAGLKGRQWREAQLNEAFAAMPLDLRSDPGRRRDYLRRLGRPSRKAVLFSLIATVLVLGFFGAAGVSVWIEDNWKTVNSEATKPAVTSPGPTELEKALRKPEAPSSPLSPASPGVQPILDDAEGRGGSAPE